MTFISPTFRVLDVGPPDRRDIPRDFLFVIIYWVDSSQKVQVNFEFDKKNEKDSKCNGNYKDTPAQCMTEITMKEYIKILFNICNIENY